MSARQDIKDRIVTVLKAAGAGPAGNRVYIGRQNVLPAASTDFPLIYVYMIREDTETLTMGPRQRSQKRDMTFVVDHWLKATTPELVESGMDTATAAIEALINVDHTLNAKTKDIVLTSTEYLYDGTEEAPAGRASMQFRVTYLSTET